MSITDDLAKGLKQGSRTFAEKAIELGPYSRRLSLRITGRSHHTGGSGSTARMVLFYDNAEVAARDDKDFDNAYLETKYSLYMEAGSVAQFRIDPSNKGATVQSYSIQVDWREQY